MSRRRLILHAGLAKTGTSALQKLLYKTRSSLLATGTWYPDLVNSPQKPHHRFLITELRTDPSLPQTASVLAKAEDQDISQVILSIEELTSHISAIREDCAVAFNQLTQDWDVEIIVVTRDHAKWRPSLYRQCIISPKQHDSKSAIELAYATTLTFSDFARLEAIQDLSSQAKIVASFGAFFPSATVAFLRYEDNFIDTFAARCGIDQLIVAKNAPRSNSMPADSYIEIIRQMNNISNSRSSSNLLRAAIAIKTQTTNLHLLGYKDKLATNQRIVKTGLLLFVQLGRLQNQDNPPLIIDAKNFNIARRKIRFQILSIVFNQAILSQIK